MKTLYFSVIAFLVIAFGVTTAYAEQPLLDYYNNSKLVLVGKVISLSQVPTTTNSLSGSQNQTKYDIQVEAYYKSPQDAKVITVYGYAKGIYFGQDPTFDVGDRVFLYLNQENGYYQIQPHSFVLNNDCDARTMIPMPTLPFEPPPISSPAMGRIFNFESDSGDSSYFFRVGDKIHINFVAENYMPLVKYATLNFTIKTENDTKTVFNDTKPVTIPPCNGQVPVSWDFTPKNSGTYLVYVNASDSISLGKQIVLFNDPSIGSSFTVRENMAGGTIEKSPYLPSPLTQFKSGVTTQNITCKQGFVLAIKKQGHQPACVDPDTVPKIVLRGWSENPLNELLLRYGNQTQANLVFYDIMNEPKIRDWSMKGWRYSDYSYAANGETDQSSVTMHLYLPSNIGKHECENGSYGLVVVNLKPVEIEHNYTEAGCEIDTTTASADPESNGR